MSPRTLGPATTHVAGHVCGRALCLFAASVAALSACDGGSSAAQTTTTVSPTTPQSTLPDAGIEPRVDLIDEAVVALEGEMGAPQQYFEINASPKVVNLFVSLNNGAVVQPWVYLDGELSSQEGQPASGFTFAASALDFDPALVLSKIEGAVPGAAMSAFVVEGGEGGVVQYTVVVNSAAGGQLVAVVGPDGAVRSVDPQ
jgi:hypothetical protein